MISISKSKYKKALSQKDSAYVRLRKMDPEGGYFQVNQMAESPIGGVLAGPVIQNAQT